MDMRDRVPTTVPAVPGWELSALLDSFVEGERAPIPAVPPWGALVKRVCVSEAFPGVSVEPFALLPWLICVAPDAIPVRPFFDLFPLLGRDCVTEAFPALPDFTVLVPLAAL